MPTLWFTPSAWIKLNWLAHVGDTEIGGFGLTVDPRELLISEFHLVAQQCSAVTVSFDDESVADYFERMVDAGYKPDQFARVWLHTHPGDSAMPSGTDERTFKRVFGSCDWAIMFVLARGGATYARLRFAAGPGGQVLIPVGVRWEEPLHEIDEHAWAMEYESNVRELIEHPPGTWPEWWDDPTVPAMTESDQDVRQLAEVLHGVFD